MRLLQKRRLLRRVNASLFTVVLVIGVIGWFGVVPVVWPVLWSQVHPPLVQASGNGENVAIVTLPTARKQDNVIIPEENRLLIPKIGVNAEIVEGKSLGIINKAGVWHEIPSTNPTTAGNMVIAGHRFKFLPPNQSTLYSMDKVDVGDEIIIFWEQEKYTYQVYETEVVEPTAVQIRDDHGFKELTIYTCTPLWTTKQRLVVKAKPVDN